MIYCTLTGTCTAWGRNINGIETTFGVSGLLYNNNILPFDRNTRSIWRQLRRLCVSGENIGFEPEIFPVVEMSWGAWKSVLQKPEVLSDQIGTGRNYNEYPYGEFRTNNDLVFFPMPYDDQRLPRKERMHGVIVNDQVKVYRVSHFN